MKKIEIYQENIEPIVIYDEDNSEISEYSKNLSEILKPSKVELIETSNCILIVRPSRISSIKISENKELTSSKNCVKVDIKGNVVKKRKKDIIMDKE